MRAKTWKATFRDGRTPDGSIELQCPRCDRDADVPTCGQPGALIIATLGLRIIFEPSGHEPPDAWLPEEIECRGCGAVFSVDESDQEVA